MENSNDEDYTRVAAETAVLLFCVSLLNASISKSADHGPTATLDSDEMRLVFDRSTGTLSAIKNKLTEETYNVGGDRFDIEAREFRVGLADTKLVGMIVEGNSLTANYQSANLNVQTRYTLRGHFAEKQVILTSPRPCGLKCVVVSHATLAPGLRLVGYRYPKYGRQPGEEPNCTIFGRTAKGGMFAGLEIPFDSSFAKPGDVTLRFGPSLKFGAGQRWIFEPAYFGVYRRGAKDDDRKQPELPLPSESTPWWP